VRHCLAICTDTCRTQSIIQRLCRSISHLCRSPPDNTVLTILFHVSCCCLLLAYACSRENLCHAAMWHRWPDLLQSYWPCWC
jgi:hypothetical protein